MSKALEFEKRVQETVAQYEKTEQMVLQAITYSQMKMNGKEDDPYTKLFNAASEQRQTLQQSFTELSTHNNNRTAIESLREAYKAGGEQRANLTKSERTIAKNVGERDGLRSEVDKGISTIETLCDKAHFIQNMSNTLKQRDEAIHTINAAIQPIKETMEALQTELGITKIQEEQKTTNAALRQSGIAIKELISGSEEKQTLMINKQILMIDRSNIEKTASELKDKLQQINSNPANKIYLNQVKLLEEQLKGLENHISSIESTVEFKLSNNESLAAGLAANKIRESEYAQLTNPSASDLADRNKRLASITLTTVENNRLSREIEKKIDKSVKEIDTAHASPLLNESMSLLNTLKEENIILTPMIHAQPFLDGFEYDTPEHVQFSDEELDFDDIANDFDALSNEDIANNYGGNVLSIPDYTIDAASFNEDALEFDNTADNLADAEASPPPLQMRNP